MTTPTTDSLAKVYILTKHLWDCFVSGWVAMFTRNNEKSEFFIWVMLNLKVIDKKLRGNKSMLEKWNCVYVCLPEIKRHLGIVGLGHELKVLANPAIPWRLRILLLSIPISNVDYNHVHITIDDFSSWLGNLCYIFLKNKTSLRMSERLIGHFWKRNFWKSSGKDLSQRKLLDIQTLA